MSIPTTSLTLSAPTFPNMRSLVALWLPVAIGSAMFAVSAVQKSSGTMHAAAVVTTGGLAWIPIGLALQRRLATMSRASLVLGLVLIVQGMHTVEHVVQIIESYRLDYPPVRSLGVVSALNVEWVHFGWNWIAWAGVVVAWLLGLRSWAVAMLLAWITAHSLEHSYMLVRYLEVVRQLDHLKLPKLGSSEVLPGVLGRDGWLALRFPSTRTTLGPLVSAPRVAIHLWWNVGEVLLLILATAIKSNSVPKHGHRPNVTNQGLHSP